VPVFSKKKKKSPSKFSLSSEKKTWEKGDFSQIGTGTFWETVKTVTNS
jgi:hypothetical protein